jgi:type IV pilus assembly protein PilA
MKKFFRENEQGFTLVELMVVVAIIGILSAVAVPNFKKYQSKSKQSEAKIQLAALYNAEIATEADYDTYGTCLGLMGYEREQRGYYAVGFPVAMSAVLLKPAFTGCTANTLLHVAAGVPLPTTSAYRPTVPLAALVANLPVLANLTGAVLPTATTFTASAAGSIAVNPAIAANIRDVWTISQAKTLVNFAPGF